MDFTEQKSQAQADIIKLILLLSNDIDLEYLAAAAAEFRTRSARHDSCAVIVPGYDPINSQILDLEADMLLSLVEFFKLNARIAEKKAQAGDRRLQQQQILKYFNL